VSILAEEPCLFDKYELSDLKLAVELFFYFLEFMERIKMLFSELLNGKF